MGDKALLKMTQMQTSVYHLKNAGSESVTIA